MRRGRLKAKAGMLKKKRRETEEPGPEQPQQHKQIKGRAIHPTVLLNELLRQNKIHISVNAKGR